MTRVLVVEDEESYSDALAYMLRKEGFEVAIAATGPDALAEFDRAGADIVLLDLMLPGIPGTEVCRQIRQTSNVPVIMVSAKDDEVDKVVGLELGADDYVTKPYSPRELVARIRAVLRRGVEPDLAPMTLEVGNVRMDVERHIVTVGGEEVRLPLKEFELLEMFLRNPGRVLTRGQLIDRVWGSDYVGDTKTLDVHVKRLRAKLEANPAEPKLLAPCEGSATSSTSDVAARPRRLDLDVGDRKPRAACRCRSLGSTVTPHRRPSHLAAARRRRLHPVLLGLGVRRHPPPRRRLLGRRPLPRSARGRGGLPRRRRPVARGASAYRAPVALRSW